MKMEFTKIVTNTEHVEHGAIDLQMLDDRGRKIGYRWCIDRETLADVPPNWRSTMTYVPLDGPVRYIVDTDVTRDGGRYGPDVEAAGAGSRDRQAHAGRPHRDRAQTLHEAVLRSFTEGVEA